MAALHARRLPDSRHELTADEARRRTHVHEAPQGKATRMNSDQRKNLRSDIWRESVSDEVSEELSFHVEMRARELAAKQGIDIEDARRTAMARFGDIKDVQAQCEEIGGRRDRDMKRNTLW